MKNKGFLKLLKKRKSNSGFTLTELLVGLIMSGIVVGALGFGLMQVLRTTKTETSKIDARSETSRALEFISEEIKRARTIESNADNADGQEAATTTELFDPSGKTVVLALDIPDISDNVGGIASDDKDNTLERVVYYLQSATGTNWKGPQVLYRWGPPLDADGNYTNGAWQAEALIDEMDDTSLSGNPCGAGETLSPSSSATVGFHACISNTGNTAQLFFSGQVENIAGNNDDNYSADTKVVTRAKETTVNAAEDTENRPLAFKTLGAEYHCKGVDDSIWSMRTDFNNSSDPEANPNDTVPWIHDPSRQSQPILINTNNPLKISSTPIGTRTDCDSNGNPGTNGTELFSSYGYSVSHTIDFSNSATFNGGSTDQPDVTGDGYVMVYRKGSTINNQSGGYSQGMANQESMGEFLYQKGYAKLDGSTYRLFNDSDTLNIPGEPGYDSNIPTSILLEDNERIIAFEVGQTDNGKSKDAVITDLDNDGIDDYFDEDGNGNPHPGFDGQDSIFILSNDAFDTTTP